MSGEGRPEGPGDGEVVRRVLAGEPELFGLLVERYTDAIYRHAERMTGRPDEAADIVQVAFVKGYRNLRRCREPERVGGWLYRIGANLCKDFLKNRRRDNLSLEDAPAMRAERGLPDEELRRREMREKIDDALERLSPEQREAFVMKHVEGRSYEEMSETLRVSVPALKMRAHRAREELKGLLEEYL